MISRHSRACSGNWPRTTSEHLGPAGGGRSRFGRRPIASSNRCRVSDWYGVPPGRPRFDELRPRQCGDVSIVTRGSGRTRTPPPRGETGTAEGDGSAEDPRRGRSGAKGDRMARTLPIRENDHPAAVRIRDHATGLAPGGRAMPSTQPGGLRNSLRIGPGRGWVRPSRAFSPRALSG